MPIRSDWMLQREGITIDTIGRLIGRTLLNPAVTLPLLLAAKYTVKGQTLAGEHGRALTNLKTLLCFGLARYVSKFLDSAVTNNWTNDQYDWNKEIVVVTGGSDGIGAIVVKLLAERGIKVAVLDVQPLKYEAPPTVHFFQCDLSSSSSIASTATSVRSTLGDPTVLINNAGCARGKTILSTTEKDLHLTFNVNTLSHYFLAQAFLPAMIAANHGLVLTVASTAAYLTAPQMVDYAASKAAALAFHEGLSAELATVYNAKKVRTVVMCQGYTRTPLFKGFDDSDRRGVAYALEPETVAEEIVKAVLRGRSAHLMLPAASWWVVQPHRGWPLWMQYGLRKRLVKLMKGWDGRQVVQPSEGKIDESGVLVE
ncbi:NAD(P)-binding protein [Mytilinidion resinicola]|uniref:Short-chain dehydrogenase/reductase 3 n=1 Tax=Mytilinidion resinicola TaxID=574789 RepID=A0A6A6YI78_9PEZI|nr:NAD(P)-binding protein [Mytilinidion resinicola]KAF2807694.1 NAD(P)-binding protein [Mytilinidion resinicola]